jgi:uncharacterized protein
MVKQTMLCLTIRFKKNDKVKGKRLEKTLIDFLIKSKVSGALVWVVLMDLERAVNQLFFWKV